MSTAVRGKGLSMRLRLLVPVVVLATSVLGARTPAPAPHPRLLFAAAGLEAIRAKARQPALAPVAARLSARADRLLSAPPLLVSTTRRGEPDPPGHVKGLEAARRLQGRALTYSMAFLLSGERRYRDAAVSELDHALTQWPIWVDTAHQPPYDLMTGELSLTFGLAYDWLYDALTPDERTRLREGVERRALDAYLDAATRPKPPFWFTARHNWNPVCNGGAVVLALSLGAESTRSTRVLDLAAPAMAAYWDHLGADGGWDEGTGYWTYGHRYAFMAADALRRAGRPEGATYLARPGARATGYFPLVFNPGRVLTASFGDSASRVSDPLLYFLAREYENADFAWFEDRAAPSPLTREGWPNDALTLVWRDAAGAGTTSPRLPAVASFASIGWALLAPSQPDPPFFLAFKNGSLAANHTHLDLNHVSVGVGDTMLLPDLGSRPYPADYFDASKRYGYYEISTAGHNTVLVGGKGQVPGRPGRLVGPHEGPGYVELVGVADGGYEVATRRARRHVVFVDRRYYVLLDEVVTEAPASFELRFHTYGAVTAPPSPGAAAWTVSQGDAALEVVPASGGLDGHVEDAVGWIRPAKVLRLTSRDLAASVVVATAIVPRRGAADRAPAVTQVLEDRRVVVRVGGDTLTFARGGDGCSLVRVETGR